MSNSDSTRITLAIVLICLSPLFVIGGYLAQRTYTHVKNFCCILVCSILFALATLSVGIYFAADPNSIATSAVESLPPIYDKKLHPGIEAASQAWSYIEKEIASDEQDTSPPSSNTTPQGTRGNEVLVRVGRYGRYRAPGSKHGDWGYHRGRGTR